MKTSANDNNEARVASCLAPEDLRLGDFVGILYETVEVPSFHWTGEVPSLSPEELVRIVYRPTEGGTPLKVKAICLPFVFIKKPTGEHQTLDVRRHQLVRLSRSYARLVWKSLGKGQEKDAALSC